MDSLHADPDSHEDDGTASGVGEWAVLLAILLGVWLRVSGLEVHSLWIDEGSTVHVATSGDIPGVLARDRHPPLSFLAFRAWITRFGQADATLRLLPALLSCASLALFARLTRDWLPAPARLLAVAVYAVSPFHVWHGQETRMYAFVELGALVAWTGTASFVRLGSVWRLAPVALGSLLAFGSHYMGGLVLPTVCTLAVVERSRRQLGTGGALALGASSLLGILFWLPWCVRVIPLQLAAPWGWQSRTSARDLAELPIRQVLVEVDALPSFLAFVGWTVGAVVLVALALFAWRFLRSPQIETLRALTVFAVPVVVAGIASVVSVPNFMPKYLIPASPGTVLMIALGLALLPRSWLRVTGGLLVAGGLLLVLVHKSGNHREDYRSACHDLAAQWRHGEPILVVTGLPAGFADSVVRHYLRDRPDMLENLEVLEPFPDRLPRTFPAPTRVHVIHRRSRYSEADLQFLQDRLHVELEGPDRHRVRYLALRASG